MKANLTERFYTFVTSHMMCGADGRGVGIDVQPVVEWEVIDGPQRGMWLTHRCGGCGASAREFVSWDKVQEILRANEGRP